MTPPDLFDPRENINHTMGQTMACVHEADPYLSNACLCIAQVDVSIDDTLAAITCIDTEADRETVFDIIHRLHDKLSQLVKRIP